MKPGTGYSLDHAYKFYRTKHKDTPLNDGVNHRLYRDICQDFNKLLVKDVLEGRRTMLPHRLGYLWFKKLLIDWDKPLINWLETRKAGSYVYHTESDYAGKWKWDRNTKDMTNLVYYSLDIANDNKVAARQILYSPDGHKRFFT
jgi:hypothetical protein